MACGYGYHGDILSLHETSGGKMLGMRKDISPRVDVLTFSADGRLLAAGCSHTIKIWRLPARFKDE